MPLERPRKRLELASNAVYLKCRQRVLEFIYECHRFVEAAQRDKNFRSNQSSGVATDWLISCRLRIEASLRTDV